MSAAKTKEQLVRSAWLVELRWQGERQCEGIGNGQKACALAILHEVAFGKKATYPFPYAAVEKAAWTSLWPGLARRHDE